MKLCDRTRLEDYGDRCIGRKPHAHEVISQLWWYHIYTRASDTEAAVRRGDRFVVDDKSGSWRLLRKAVDWLRRRQAQIVVALFGILPA